MIDLTNKAARQGALDALNILIKAKNKPIEISGGGGNGGGQKLQMPKNVHISQEDAEQKETHPQNNGEKQQGDAGQNGRNDEKQQDDASRNGGDAKADVQKIDNGEGGQRQSQGKDRGESQSGQTSGSNGFKMSDEEKAAMMDEIRQEKDFADEQAEQAEIDAEKARDQMLNGVKAANFKELEDDLYYAIASQVAESNELHGTYEHGGDPVYDDYGFILPQDEYAEKKTKPLLYVFIDQSGSFGQNLINRSKSVVKVLDDFVQDGKIAEPKYFVFGDHVLPLGAPGYVGSSTGA